MSVRNRTIEIGNSALISVCHISGTYPTNMNYRMATKQVRGHCSNGKTIFALESINQFNH